MVEIKKPKAEKSLPVPSGTVTFLFTDIEGSTKLWEAQHDSMRQAVARHDALMRQCIAARGGHVFKTVGDAFCAAFATAPDAVAAVLSAQQALHAEPWPEGIQIRARMALHTGAAEVCGGDYFGTPLNRVARLLAIGHGGQTLVSGITHDLCRDRLPVGTTLKPLGEHSLKDVARREAVFQLCHPGLPSTFPPLRTSAAHPIGQETPSIAVLPFTDLSKEKDQEYFADGVTEELLNVLSKIRGLRVASRTSAFYFKGKDVDIPTVAQKLNVATILEGSVRKAGNRVRITAQLVEVASDSHLWSETYDRELNDIFAVQDDIAQSVVRELRAALLGEKVDVSASAQVKAEVRAAAKGRGENVEAFRLYLQGRFFEDRYTREDTAKAIMYYRNALDVDPQYALALAELSRAYAMQGGSGWLPIMESVSKAREAAERALQVEPDLAEAHAAFSEICMFHDWDWKAADASLRRALELSPGDARVMRSMAILAGCLGRMDETIALLRRAAALDPLAGPVHRSLARWCYSAGLLEDAETELNKVFELNPHGSRAYFLLGLVRLTQGRLDEALETFQREVERAFRLLGLALAYYALARNQESGAALQELIEKDAAASACQIAQGYAYRGEANLAFEWLERAYLQRDSGISFLKTDPLLLNLHGDARWQPFLKKMGLAG